jgi:hypothetical protein
MVHLINKVSSSHPQAQTVQAEKGRVFSRLGPQLPHQGTPPPSQVQGLSCDHVIPVASGVATVSTTNNVVLDGWVTVKSRRKASKQSCCNSKGKEVVVVELVFDVNTCVTHSPQYVQEKIGVPPS